MLPLEEEMKSALGTIPGVQEGLLRYDKDGMWMTELLKYPEE